LKQPKALLMGVGSGVEVEILFQECNRNGKKLKRQRSYGPTQ